MMKVKIKEASFQLIVVIIIGLIFRAILLYLSRNLGLTILDEREYNAIAVNIIEGKGFSLNGQLTAYRPPLYPAFVAFVYYMMHTTNFIYVRILQGLISIFNVILVYCIGKEIFNKKIGILAASLFCIYPALLGFNIFVLSETLFIFLFCLSYYYFLRFLKERNPTYVVLTGIFLGLSCLTRSFIFAFVLLLGIFLFFIYRKKSTFKNIFIYISLLFLSFSLIVTPWVARNIKLFRSFVLIDTASGSQFYMGNSQYTRLNKAWELSPDISLDYTLAYKEYFKTHNMAWNEASKSKAGIVKALEFILQHPSLTLKRDIVKAFNLWGNERTIVAGMVKGYFGQQNKWTVSFVWSVIAISYMFLILAGIFGIVFGNRENKLANALFLLTISYFTAIHALVFGHPRYHLPLIPLIGIYASYGIINIKTIWHFRKTAKFGVSLLLCLALISIWIREFIVFITEFKIFIKF